MTVPNWEEGEMSYPTDTRKEKPIREKSYRCPWCDRVDKDVDAAKIHNLSCNEKNGVLWKYMNKLPKRKVREVIKTKS